jgi:Ubiquitin carboxyl-terminal hydrolase
MTNHSKYSDMANDWNEEECAPNSRWPRRIRGIRNITGTACHLNAALIVIAYCLGDAIPEFVIASCDKDETKPRNEPALLMTALVALLRELRRTDGVVEPVNPTEFYAALHAQKCMAAQLSPEQCGDAVLALIRWLQYLRAELDGSPNVSCHPWLDPLLFSGRMHSVLRGIVHTSLDTQPCCRRKVLKERTLMNPFPIPTFPRAKVENQKGFTSLSEALQHAFLAEEPVEGYQWSDSDDRSKEEEQIIATTKRPYLTQLPPILMIHLEGRRIHAPESSPVGEKNGDSMEIPSFFDGSDYLSASDDASNVNTDVAASNDVFHLRGGILHISHRCKEEAGDDSIGHYVAVVSTTPSGAEPPDWYLIDDDLVISVSLEQVLAWMAGDCYKVDVSDDTDELYARGVLFVYHRDDLPDIVDSLSISLFQKTDFSTPFSPAQNGRGQNVSVFGDTSWDPGNDFSSMGNTTVRRVGVPVAEQFCAQGVRQIDPETGQCVVTYEDPSSSRASPVLQKSVEWRKNNYINKDTASSVTLETHVGDTNGNSSKRSSPLGDESAPDDEQSWTGRRLRMRWSGGMYYEGSITQFDPSSGQHTVTFTDGDVRQYHLSKKTFQWLDDDADESRCTTPPSSAKFKSLWLDDSDVSDNDNDET